GKLKGNSKPVSRANSIIAPEMKEKILLGQRRTLIKMKLLGGIHQTLIIAILTMLQKLLKSTMMVQKISKI
ncbi:hypothetical protein, partial [Lysinibacillus mangiferihumi]|uniref:hypothetical protein n=1 Tax=Lysinibacillus mangiferihumi TaxID=1130819 RepID=UPI002012AAB7